MSVQFCFALLALSSLTAASDPDCEELLKPLEEQSQVSGKWIFHAGTSVNEEALNELKNVNSSWIKISLIPGSDDMNLAWGDKMDEKCLYGNVTSTNTGNSTMVTFKFNATDHEHVGKYLKTCSDCILWSDTSVSSAANGEVKKSSNLYIFTKSGKLDEADLEVFKKQAACLNFPADLHFAGITDLCPEEAEAATDVKEA